MKTKLLGALALITFAVSTLLAADALDEKAFQKHMKSVGKVAKDFKGHFDSKNAAAIEKDATVTAEAYKAMTAFWQARKTDDAVKLSEASGAAALMTAAAAKAGDWDRVKVSWGVVNKNCKDCHDAHRQKLPDGGYKIK